MNPTLQEYRCPHCHKLLFKGQLTSAESIVEVKCKACKEIGIFQGCAGQRHLDIEQELSIA
jgi:phage FluMu protein Com